MEKKIIITILSALIVILAVIAGLRLISGEDDWMCVNNQWVKHGHPSAPMPATGCGDNLIGGQKDEHSCLVPAGYSWCPSANKCQRMWEEYCAEFQDQYRGNASTTISNFDDCVAAGNPVMESYPRQCAAGGQSFTEEIGSNEKINLISPKPNEVVNSPLTITGEAHGNWYFEASFPVRLEDEEGNIIAQTTASAQSEWMTENFVPFVAKLNFTPGDKEMGYLVLEKDNPSDLPENDESIEIPVLFVADTTTVKVYFNNNKLDPEISCNKVFAVERVIPKTEAIGEAALEQLLLGPTAAETADNYASSINPNVGINSLIIKDSVARVDFDEEIEKAVGGSCRVSAIRAQITETLKQFPTVKEVIISVEGNIDEALQP